jgi:hypothetical protein
MTERTDQERLKTLADALLDVVGERELEPADSIQHLKFKDPINGKGLLWQGRDYTKQFVFQDSKLFSSETINIARDKNISINNIKVLDQTELGSSVVRSNLREVGQLNGLVVNGGFRVNNFLVFDHNSDRLGIGTEEPNAALSIVDDAVEIVLGAKDHSNAAIGTYNNSDLHLVTGNQTRITIGADGNIQLGSVTDGESKIQVHGSIGVNVTSIDPRSKLHVNGSIKFNDNLHLTGVEAPSGGSFTLGDIVWNSNPQPGNFVGWVCVKAGNPGVWATFGEIR